MTWEALSKRTDVRPVTVVRLIASVCTLTHGTSPCTATGLQCYNTRNTCQDTANYSVGTKNYDFCGVNDNLEGYLPFVQSFKLSPSRLEAQFGLGRLAQATIVFEDSTILDSLAVDPYEQLRSGETGYTEPSGTFWQRFRARNRFLQNKTIEVYTGFKQDGQAFSLSDCKKHTFVIDKFTPLNKNSTITLTANDPLSLSIDDKSVAPKELGVTLSASLTDSATTANITIVRDDLPESGHALIDDEIITFTHTLGTSTCTIVRAQAGTTATAHDADANFKLMYVVEDVQPHLIIQDLLENYTTAFDSDWITIADWEEIVDTFNPLFLLTVYIVEPTSVEKLINEICKTCLLYVYWSATESEVKLKSFFPDDLDATLDTVTDDDLIDVTIKEMTSKWFSRSGVYFAPKETFDNSIDNSKFISIAFNPEIEAEQPLIQKIQTRWFDDTNKVQADTVANRLMMGSNNVPKVFTLTMDISASYKVGDSLNVLLEDNTDETGAPITQQVRVHQATPIDDKLVLECYTINISNRLFRLCPNSFANDYLTASEEERAKYGFLCNNSDEMSNGDEGYRLI